MAYSVVDVADVPVLWGGFKVVRHHLGATAFGFTQIDFPPDKIGSEHDETESGEEEVYLALSGGGTREVDGQTVEMRPGRYICGSVRSSSRTRTTPCRPRSSSCAGSSAASPTSTRSSTPSRDTYRQRRTRLRAKNARFAGRSARRRIRYGYHSGPYGVATRTLNPRATRSCWRPCRTP